MLLLLVACSPGGGPLFDDPCDPGGDPTLEIGTGAYEYEDLEPDGTVELVHGPQGGYHVLVGLAATNIDVEGGTASGVLTGTIGGEMLAESSPWLGFRCNAAAGELQTWGTFLIYDAQPEDLDGKTTTIDAEVTDLAGDVVTASIDVVIEDPLLE
jgi:hypothetical protein